MVYALCFLAGVVAGTAALGVVLLRGLSEYLNNWGNR